MGNCAAMTEQFEIVQCNFQGSPPVIQRNCPTLVRGVCLRGRAGISETTSSVNIYAIEWQLTAPFTMAVTCPQSPLAQVLVLWCIAVAGERGAKDGGCRRRFEVGFRNCWVCGYLAVVEAWSRRFWSRESSDSP